MLVVTAALLWTGGAPWAQSPSVPAGTYTLDAERSRLTIHLERAGAFAVLAHRHVLAADGMGGRITIPESGLQETIAQFSLPVASILVDPPQARTEAGLEPLDEDDRADIRETMLGTDQLNAAAFPRIVATVERVEGTPPNLSVVLNLRVRDVSHRVTVPMEIAVDSDTVRASGQFTVRHADFGLEPYRALLGGIAVADEITVRFDLVAARAQP